MSDTRTIASQIRKHTLKMVSLGKSSHIGAVFSIADLMAVLYGRVMRISPEALHDPQRDRFILSKGHAGAAVYATLAECGFLSTDVLDSHYQNGSILSGHVSHKGVPGVEFSTGSLGHGLPVGVGMALGFKKKGLSAKAYVLMGDGECDEGTTWESALFAAHHCLDNLVVVVDYNKIQSLDTVESTLNIEPFEEKWRAFNWEVRRVDGHDHDAIGRALTQPWEGKPLVILADTIKGKGVSFMEHSVLWHYRSPQGGEYDKALEELNRGGR